MLTPLDPSRQRHASGELVLSGRDALGREGRELAREGKAEVVSAQIGHRARPLQQELLLRLRQQIDRQS